jgi:hypothetical protein
MGVIGLKGPLPLGALGVVVIYFHHKDEKSTAFDINLQRHHINEKKISLIEEKKNG